MKLSTKSRYAVRCMIALASTDNKISIAEISKQEEISERYLELIFAKLKEAGLIMSIRGSLGGYKLAIPADSITMWDIIYVMEHNLNIIKDFKQITPMNEMLDSQVWEPINQNISSYLKSILLSSLL